MKTQNTKPLLTIFENMSIIYCCLNVIAKYYAYLSNIGTKFRNLLITLTYIYVLFMYIFLLFQLMKIFYINIRYKNHEIRLC